MLAPTPIIDEAARTGVEGAADAAFLGYGLGLRQQHHIDILTGDPPVDWFEIISEDFIVPGGVSLEILDRIRERFPVVMHGVSLSIASTSALDETYLAALKELASRIEPRWVSDHLCWTGVHGINLHDLLPIPYTLECLEHVARRVHRVQEVLGRRLTLENVSSPVRFTSSEMSNGEFIAELSRRTGCGLLLDINNAYINAFNQGEDPYAFLDAIPTASVVQFHLAGHEHRGTHIIDSHDRAVAPDVWDLYAAALRRFGPVSTMIERDDDIPPLEELLSELDEARRIAHRVLGDRSLPSP